MVLSESSTIILDDEDKALKSMLDTFGSNFSIQDIASAFCKARGDTQLAGELLCRIGISSSDTAYQLHNGDEKSNTSSKNVSPNETNPLELETSNFSGSVHSAGEPLSQSDNSFYKEIENYLFEILGNSFQLERSAIHDVLSQCGYDMKKSMETLFDLAAITLDQRNDFDDDCKSKSNSESLSHQKEVPKQIFEESRSRTITTNAFILKKTIEQYEQQDFVYKEDEDVEGSYGFLRKAVKEYRDAMKEYYKAAVKAFASSDYTRAAILLEKPEFIEGEQYPKIYFRGHFYSNKAREANDESARKIYETSSEDEEINDEMCLDLQDHDRKEAIRLLKCHLHSLSGIPSIKTLKIILGVGGKYVEKRKRLVKKLLDRESIKWIEDENSGTILIRLDEINPNYLSFSSTRHEE